MKPAGGCERGNLIFARGSILDDEAEKKERQRGIRETEESKMIEIQCLTL